MTLARRTALAVVVTSFGVAGSAAASRADEAPPTSPTADARVLVVDAQDEALTTRLVAEIRFVGLEPEIVALSPDAAPDDLVALARAHQAKAAIAVTMQEDDGHAEVWIADVQTGERVRVMLPLTPEIGPREIAVRAVEHLRARMFEPAPGPTDDPEPSKEAGTPPPPPTPPPRPSAARPRPPRVRLGADVAVGGAPGGLGALAHLRAQVIYTPVPRWGLLAEGAAPLHATVVSAAEGEARVRLGWVGVGPWVALRDPSRIVLPTLAATAGPVFVGMRGNAAPGFVDGTDVVVDALFNAHAGLEVSVSARVRVGLRAAAGICARDVRVRFAGRDIADWCRPYIVGALGVSVAVW